MTSRWQFTRRALLAAVALALAAELAHAVTGFGGAGVDRLFSDHLYLAIELAAVGLCAARALHGPDHRVAWCLIASGLAAWTIGDAIWIVRPQDAGELATDVFYLGFFALFCGGLALLAAQGRERVAARMWIDGLLAALAVSALVVALLFDPIVEASHGSVTQIAVNIAYPVGDLVVVGFVLAAFATQAWRPGRGWMLLGLGAVLSAVADTLFVYQDAIGTYRAGAFVDVLWPAAFACVAWAAWQPWEPVGRDGHGYGRQTFVLPSAFAAVALGLLGYDHFAPISDAAAGLATLALGVAILRAGITFRENALLLRTTRHEALTDGLTGLPNRRRLMLDLDRACTPDRRGRLRQATFAFFDLDGFKSYNDTFGHAAGDMLLDRLAARLGSVARGHGRAYRLGGDEFCVLLDGLTPDHPLLSACREALCEHGEGFRVGASCGAVTIPGEATTATQALHLADQRMYAAKDGTRSSSRRQTRDVLLAVLHEREPELHRHLQGVAGLAVAIGRQLALSAEQLDEVARAAELHDVGKIAIPDQILHKPGPLDEREWELMRQHTIIGDRILGAAPAMRPVAAIVRASHERYDGDGYPDGLSDEQIPLGARIVAVCDAYSAMTSDRPYQRALSPADALAELHRHAGTQFDPQVVAAFEAITAREPQLLVAGAAASAHAPRA